MASGGNILAIPFRRTHSLRLSDAIKSYISSKYDQHPATFQHDLEVIDQLRKDAVASLEAHSSGVRKLQGYAAQLVWMGGKFPVDVREARPKQNRCRLHLVPFARLPLAPPTDREQPPLRAGQHRL
ncbi:hypothetical protein KC347_g191 [Hortaea werneckii]|nr:hypothetical protein KC347_g191 [Hortaea werneckii]